MTTRSLRSGLAAALIMATLAVAGCTGSVAASGTRPAGPDGSGSPPVASSASATGAVTATGSGTPGAALAAPSTAELATMKTQLSAMQKEIDALALPSDGDFSGAAGAVY